MSLFINNSKTHDIIRRWSLEDYIEQQEKGEIDCYGTPIPLQVKLLDNHARDQHQFKAGVICELYAKSLRWKEKEEPTRTRGAAIEDQLENYSANPRTQGKLQEIREKFFVSVEDRVSEEPESKEYLYFKNIILGAGANHSVRLGLTDEGECIAISKPKSNSSKTQKGLVMSDQEVWLHQRMKGKPNILQLKRVDDRRAVYELARTDLSQAVKMPGAMIPRWMYECLKGGLQIVSQGFIHLDLKPENVFVMEDGTAKVGDLEFFATVEGVGPNQSRFNGGNLAYYSPERRGRMVNRPYGDVSGKDNVWAMMHLLCEINNASGSSTPAIPEFQLSPEFQKRFKEYWQVIGEALKEAWKESQGGLSEQIADEKKMRKEKMRKDWVHIETLCYFENLPSSPEMKANLFAGLKAKTPLDKIVYEMAFIRPEHRIDMQQAVEQFELQMLMLDLKKRPGYRLPAKKVEETLFFNKPVPTVKK